MMQRKSSQQKNHNKSSKPIRRKPPIDVSQDRRDLPASIQAILDLQGMIGNRATTRLLQRQNEEGSATVVGSASSDESAYEGKSGTFTQDIAGDGDIYEDPTENVGETATKSRLFDCQHPSIAQMGIRADEIKGEKLGAYIGNSSYPHLKPKFQLPGAKTDVETMKGTMEGHDYKTLGFHENSDKGVIDNIYGGAVKKAKSGDALLLYYVGHGLKDGLLGSEAKFEEVKEPEDIYEGESEGGQTEEQEGGQGEEQEGLVGTRGFEIVRAKQLELTGIAPFSKIMQQLEAGIAGGVHTTFIADACHSGEAADLVRVKAEEKLAKTEKPGVKMAMTQVKRLEEMKEQIPEWSGKATDTSRGGILDKPITLEEDGEAAGKAYWDKVVFQELVMLGAYLRLAGKAISTPAKPADYTKSGIEQQINKVINALIDLGEELEQEDQESTMEKVPG